ncbi:MAG TPA: MMPL family transporter [Jiangellaceae bacterium]|nr:MMPL family transporter [Jiangellaceae bacterium]
MTASTTTTIPRPEPSTPREPTRPRGPIVAVATWSARHRWTALLLWIAFVAAAIVGGGMVGSKEIDDGEETIGASAAADRALLDAEFGELASESILVQNAGGGQLDASAADTALAELNTGLTGLAGVAAVSEPVPSADGTSQLVEVSLVEGAGTDEQKDEAAADAARDVQEVVTDLAAAHPELRVEQVGENTIGDALDQMYEDDFARAEFLSVPVTLAILLVVFGALIAAGVPILLALSSVGAAMGLSAFASYLVPSNEFLASVVLLVGMAVGVDYSLFYIRRDREERAKGDSVEHAISVVAATSGRAVVVSGITVAVAMSGMFLSGFSIFSAFAMGTILVVSVAVLGSVTVLPALLSILGRWVDRPRIPLLWRLARRNGGSRFWPAVLRPVLRRPVVALTLGVGALAALAAPALGMTLSNPDIDDMPDSIPEIQTYQRITDAYPSEGKAHTVAVWSEDGSALDAPAVDAAVAELTSRTDAGTAFFATEGVVPEVEYAEGGEVARFSVPAASNADDPQGRGSLEELRELVPETVGAVPGIDTGVTGEIAWDIDFRDVLSERLPLVIGFVLLLTVLVLVLAFRSLAIALTAAALNLLSVAAAYGLLVLVFQNTWAEGLLDFTSNGAIITWLPLFLFVILFGLSMDYHVFVVSRIREGRRAGLSTREAVAEGITKSAGVVTSAALVMVAVFSIFATLSPLDFKQMGVGLAAAILIDATIVRAVLLPAAMSLLGERNWWMPRWLRRLPALDHS